MEVVRKNTLKIAILLILIILTHSCRVYHRPSVSLMEAVTSEKRVKIKTKDHQTLRFKKVIYVDGNFYGITSSTFMDKTSKTLLFEDTLQSIRLHNVNVSIILGSILTLIVTFFIVFTVAVLSSDFGF